MNILLTNDDGIDAPGLKILYDRMSKNHDVYVCAPSTQMSAMSHSIHLFQELEMRRIDEKVYALAGSPVDCVKTGIFGFFKHVDFDLVVSGINEGPNMGDDVIYSGTVAAAREAAMNGYFALACSFGEWKYEIDYRAGAEYIEKLIDNLTPAMLAMPIFLNINFPDLKEFKGVKVTHLGIRQYRDFIKTVERDGKQYAVIGGDVPVYRESHGSDLDCLHSGYISVTPLSSTHFDRSLIRKFKRFERIFRA